MDVNRWRTSELDEVKERVGTCGNVADDGESRRSVESLDGEVGGGGDDNNVSVRGSSHDINKRAAEARRYGYGYGQGYISPSNYMEIQPLGLTSRGYTNTEYISVIQNRAPFTEVMHIR
ncbi:hypothetical protein E2542_SST24975 [Spatholobus suberectus]|nr:hypothetical protein E2542_SST24975 [Spatholobus suberectus]